ncbi:hypothetical protein GOODEAATRI_008420, partial [Goodea atripinnis]
GKLTSQGKLLQQETFCVWEQDGGVLSRSKERRVFLFEQVVIFSELLRKGSNNPGYQFKNSIKDFVAVREDEISVFRGEKVQILSSNQQGQSLVYRPANSESPAAEGWVPRSVLKKH